MDLCFKLNSIKEKPEVFCDNETNKINSNFDHLALGRTISMNLFSKLNQSRRNLSINPKVMVVKAVDVDSILEVCQKVYSEGIIEYGYDKVYKDYAYHETMSSLQIKIPVSCRHLNFG